MIEQERRRFLRPGLLVVSGARVWLVDRVQPVALVVDATSGDRVALVGWPQAPAGPSPERRVVLPADDGLWVQQHDGPLVLVSADVPPTGRYVAGTTLAAVSAHGAWCAPEPRAQDLAATPDPPPSDFPTSARLHLARRDQPTRTVLVAAPVVSLRAVDGDLYVEVETGAWNRRPLGTSTSWELDTGTTWLRLPAEQEVPDELSLAHHGDDARPPVRSGGGRHHRLADLADLTRDDGERARPHARTPGLDWFVGAAGARTPDVEQLYAVAYAAGTAREQWRLPIGFGAVAATTATGGHLWVAVAHRSPRSHRPSSPTGVVRVGAATGHVETVVEPDGIDTTELAWPLGPPPVDAEDYASSWQHRLSNLDACWTDTDGHVLPLSEGLSDSRVDVVGTWPDTALHVTFSWARRPGVRLRRVVGLYDDLGRPSEPSYADVHLMEDLDTGRVPAAPAPGSDHLDL